MLLSPALDFGGSVYMVLDPTVVKKYYAQVPGSWDNSGKGTEWTVPCDATLPDLTLHAGGGSAVIPGKVLMAQQKSPDLSSESSYPICSPHRMCKPSTVLTFWGHRMLWQPAGEPKYDRWGKLSHSFLSISVYRFPYR